MVLKMNVICFTLTLGNLFDTASYRACSTIFCQLHPAGSHKGHNSGSPHASTALWPSGKSGLQYFADNHHTLALMEEPGGPHPLVLWGRVQMKVIIFPCLSCHIIKFHFLVQSIYYQSMSEASHQQKHTIKCLNIN